MVPALSGSGIILWSLSCLAGLPFKPSCFLEFPDGDFMGTMNNHCILEIPCGELMDALHCILQFPTGELMHPMHCIGCTNSPSGNPKNKLCASSTLWPSILTISFPSSSSKHSQYHHHPSFNILLFVMDIEGHFQYL